MMHYFQIVVPPASAPWYVGLLLTILPIATGWLSNLAMDGLRQLIVKLDVAAGAVKQIVSILVAIGVSILTAKFGATIAPDLHDWTAASLNALFTILAQQGIYRWKGNNVAAAQGSATIPQRRMGVVGPTKVH